VLHIRSIYDRDGTDAAPIGRIPDMANPSIVAPDNREARFLRIVKNVPIPDDDVRDFDNSAFGRAQTMRDILGYVPIEPDGSAKFKVPADMPFTLDIVDASGKRVADGFHPNWLHLRPGEVRECTGCHTASSERPHGRQDAEADSANAGANEGSPFSPHTMTLTDAEGDAQFPKSRESMAEYYARVVGPRTPSMDIIFKDEWTIPANNITPGADINLRYVDIESAINATPENCPPLETAPPRWTPPTTCTDTGSWASRCRTTIHYEQHIQPLWEADRRICDGDIEGDTEDGIQDGVKDHTCTTCHNRVDRDGMAQVPDGQLELTGEISPNRNTYITSYTELMFGDVELELVEGSLTPRLVDRPTGRYETDAEGNLILDDNNEPIPIIDQVEVPVSASMSSGGARSSNRFFSCFERICSGSRNNVSHVGYLSPAELKLIAEWLDIGGQYYNDPFVAPLD
jgi:hypothetical protein